MKNNVNVNEINIIIADDETKTCEEIKKLLSKYEQIKILGIANTDEEEIKMIEELKPDVVVTDLMRHDSFSGLDIIKDYAEKQYSPKFIILSFTPNYAKHFKYKNITAYICKYPNSNISILAYEIICAKRRIWKEQQDLLEQLEIKEQQEKVKENFLNKIKKILLYNHKN